MLPTIPVETGSGRTGPPQMALPNLWICNRLAGRNLSAKRRLRYSQRVRPTTILLFLAAIVLLSLAPLARTRHSDSAPPQDGPRYSLGFDLNQYPGDAALPVLRKTFSFSSFWLGPPPGEKRSTWSGKRAILRSQGFGFAVLFNARNSHALRNRSDARQKGTVDAELAAKSAAHEGFAKGIIIFLDIEEGGRLPAPYHEYISAWTEGLERAGYRPGVYGSAIPVSEGLSASITTVQDIQNHAGAQKIAFWVYNLSCPPSPGCAFPSTAPSPQQSGLPSARIWQYAQSPRRKEFSAHCPANYAPDGNCYAPGDSAHEWFLDANTASSADPSSAK